MEYIIISAVFIFLLIICVIFFGPRHRPAPGSLSLFLTVLSVRVFVLLITCMVPFLAFLSWKFNSVRWALYADAAATVTSAAVFLIGFSAFAQRILSVKFRMDPALKPDEIIFIMAMPAVIFLTFLPSGVIIFFYLAPAIYSSYLMYRLIKKPVKN